MPNKSTRSKTKRAKIYEIPGYAQSEEFTGSAACTMMVLKYINPNFKMKKDVEFEIWNDAIGGSIWHGSKYGIAYALAKRGAKPRIISSNVKDEGYERKLAVYEGTNLDTLRASYNEIREKVKSYKITEEHKSITINTVKKELDDGRIPIVLVNANGIDSNTDAGPQWVVVKGYDDDTFYINDPYSDNTVAMEPHVFKSVLGYDNECHIISVSSRRSGDIKSR